MKKIVLVLVLGLILPLVPSGILAFAPPPPPEDVPSITGGVIVAGVLGFLLLTEGSSAKEAKATGNEFTDLNNRPGFTQLLKQMAGGSLNTMEILK